ncbi:MAG: sigma-70 family RNA polymerase sigma factor [Actinomycetota bacterium]
MSTLVLLPAPLARAPQRRQPRADVVSVTKSCQDHDITTDDASTASTTGTTGTTDDRTGITADLAAHRARRVPTTAADAMPLVQRGDRTAFAVVYDELAPAVFGVVRRVLRDRAMSEEVTQEIFLELWRTAERFDPERASVSTWAITIARRRAVDRVRREQSRRDRTERLAVQSAADEPVGMEEYVVERHEADRLRTAVSTLPEPQRVVIELAFFGGRSHGAIADELDLPLGTVKGRVRGGLSRLKATLASDEPAGGQPDARR